jgi:hypothetical protein
MNSCHPSEPAPDRSLRCKTQRPAGGLLREAANACGEPLKSVIVQFGLRTTQRYRTEAENRTTLPRAVPGPASDDRIS